MSGNGWISLGTGRTALEVPGGCIVESYDDESGVGTAMVFVPGVKMAELVAANDGEAPDEPEPDELEPDIDTAKRFISQADSLIRDIGFVAPECLPERYIMIRSRLESALHSLSLGDDLDEDEDDHAENFDGIPF